MKEDARPFGYPKWPGLPFGIGGEVGNGGWCWAERTADAAADETRAGGLTDMGRARGEGDVFEVGMCDLRRPREEDDFCLRGIPLLLLPPEGEGDDAVPATLPSGGAAPGGSGGGIGGACPSRWCVRAARLPSAEDVRRMAEAVAAAGDAPLPMPRPVLALVLALELAAEPDAGGAGEGVGVTALLTLPELGPAFAPLKTGIAVGGMEADGDRLFLGA